MSAKLKNLFLLTTAVIFAFLATSLRGPALDANASAHPQHSQRDSNLPAHIARIENGLLPAVVIKGEPPKPMTISEQMAVLKVPGVSIAFFDHGQVIWTRTYGFADLLSKKPVNTDTLFQAASISKPVTALAALRLVQEGKLSLDEDVNVKLKTWKVPENAFTEKEKVTLRRILSHSAGLTVHGFPGYASDETVPTLLQILNGEKPANTAPIRVDVVPGTLWRYSGGGFVVLQTLMSDVTGKPFPQLMKELVLDPLGMTHSTFDQPLPKVLWPTAATPYRANGDPVKGGWHIYPEMAPAGLWTTPSDLARLAIEVQSEYAGKSAKILNQSMAKQMLTHQMGDWGLGFGLESPGQPLRFDHSGGNEGFRCDLEAYTDSGQGLVIMTNSDSGGALYTEIIRAVATEYDWPDFHPAEHALLKANPSSFQMYAGTYEVPGVGKLTVTMKPDGPYIQAEPFGPDPQELLPESLTQFFILAADITFTFQKDQAGQVYGLVIHTGSQTLQANKIS
jgi:CubicO group peptidase (beta-lactamase class C family)